MLGKQDFEEVLESIDRSKPIPDRLADLDVDADQLKSWLITKLDSSRGMAGPMGAGIEIGLLLGRKSNEVHT